MRFVCPRCVVPNAASDPQFDDVNATGKLDQSPFITMQATSLAPGQSMQVPVQFANPQRVSVSYSSAVYAGQF
jgi:hypothetical protein